MIGKQFVLDTSILVHSVRQNRVWQRIQAEHNLVVIEPKPIVSVVSHGEIRALSLRHDWGERKLDRMEFSLEFFNSYQIDERVIEQYAALDHRSIQLGRAIGDNDLWIAATAAVTGSTLLTTDRDFEHLAPDYLDWQWIDPKV